MAKYNFKITDYSVHLGERVTVNIPVKGKAGIPIVLAAVITCRGEGGEHVQVNFYREKDEKLPSLTSSFALMEDGKPSGIIWEPERNYPNFIDLLRNESPIWGLIEANKEGTEVRLYTGRWEPVGVGDEDYVPGVKEKT